MIVRKISTKKLDELKEAAGVSLALLKLVWQTERLLLFGVSFSYTIPAFIPFINLYIYKLVIDMVVAIINGAAISMPQFYPLIGLRIATYFVQEVAFRTQGFVMRLLWMKLPIVMSEMVLQKLSSLDMQYYEDSKFRDLLEKTRESYNVRPQQLIDHIFLALQGVIGLAISFIAIAKLNWFLVVLISAVAIPEFISQTQRSKLSWGLWSQNAPQRKRYGYLEHILLGPREVKEVRIFSLAKTFIGEVMQIQKEFYKENLKLVKQNYFLNLIFNGLSTVVFIGIEVFVILEAIAKRVTVGDINFYTGLVSNFQNSLGGFFRSINSIFDNSLYVKNVFEVMRLEPIIKSPENPVKVDFVKTPLIEFRNVSFKYPETKKFILKDFFLVINPGEKVALVGENGAGKSTIIKLLARFYDVDAGEILINGVNLKEIDLHEWYKCLGILFQDFNRYDHTVRENIGFGKIYESVGLDEISRAAHLAGARGMIEKLDKGYEQMLGKTFEEGVELSGGQWQKIALARAFLRNAPVLVLDEPTASIDARAESEIFNKVEKLSKEKTVIIISHRFSTVRNADKIYVVDKGKIVESGSHENLMKENGQYATLFNLQAKGYQ